jgi:hypothetical protein
MDDVVDSAVFPEDNLAGSAPGLYASVSVTRPATAPTYAAGDVVGGALDFNLAAISGSSIEIRTTSLRKDVAALIAGETSYILHCYNVTPPSALADDAPWTLPAGDRAAYLGPINLGTPIAATSTLYVELNAVGKMLRLSGTHLFGYLVTSGSFAAVASTVYTVNVHAVQL